MDWRSFSDNLRCTRGSRPSLQASNNLIASAGVRTRPWYVSIMLFCRTAMCCIGRGKAGKGLWLKSRKTCEGGSGPSSVAGC